MCNNLFFNYIIYIKITFIGFFFSFPFATSRSVTGKIASAALPVTELAGRADICKYSENFSAGLQAALKGTRVGQVICVCGQLATQCIIY